MNWLQSIFAPGHARAVDDANAAIDDTLKPDSYYYQAGDMGIGTAGTQANDYLQQAAALQASNIAPNTGAMDGSAAQLGALSNIYQDQGQHGGRLEEAILGQAQRDLATTGLRNITAQGKKSADTVNEVATSERGAAYQNANQSRAQQLLSDLKAATYRAAASHANMQAAYAGRGVQNSMGNTQATLNNALREGALSARAGQASASNEASKTGFANAMTALQTGVSVLSQGLGTASSMMNTSGVAPTTAAGSNATYMTTADTAQGSGGYAVPSITTGTSRLALGPTDATTPDVTDTFVNPITGATENTSMPSSASAWGSWLSNSTSLSI